MFGYFYTEKKRKFCKFSLITVYILFLVSFALNGLFGVSSVFADGIDQQIIDEVKKIEEGGEGSLLEVPEGSSDVEVIREIVKTVVKIAIPAGVFVLGLLFSYVVYIMVTSQGNPEKLQEAREVLVNAISGFALIAMSATVLIIIAGLLRIPTEW